MANNVVIGDWSVETSQRANGRKDIKYVHADPETGVKRTFASKKKILEASKSGVLEESAFKVIQAHWNQRQNWKSKEGSSSLQTKIGKKTKTHQYPKLDYFMSKQLREKRWKMPKSLYEDLCALESDQRQLASFLKEKNFRDYDVELTENALRRFGNISKPFDASNVWEKFHEAVRKSQTRSYVDFRNNEIFDQLALLACQQFCALFKC